MEAVMTFAKRTADSGQIQQQLQARRLEKERKEKQRNTMVWGAVCLIVVAALGLVAYVGFAMFSEYRQSQQASAKPQSGFDIMTADMKDLSAQERYQRLATELVTESRMLLEETAANADLQSEIKLHRIRLAKCTGDEFVRAIDMKVELERKEFAENLDVTQIQSAEQNMRESDSSAHLCLPALENYDVAPDGRYQRYQDVEDVRLAVVSRYRGG
jgi:hypothetical protein